MHSGIHLGSQCMANRSAKQWVNVKLLQFPTCRPMNGLFVHWSRGWGVLFSERLVSVLMLSKVLVLLLILRICVLAPTLLHWRHNERDGISNARLLLILGSTSIIHRSHASAMSIRGLCYLRRCGWPVLWWPEWCSPAPGYLHVRCLKWWRPPEVISSYHCTDVIMGAMVSQSTGLSIVYLTVCLGADQRKYQSPASLVTGEFPSQRTSNTEKVSIWWRHHVIDTVRWCVIARFITKEIIRK